MSDMQNIIESATALQANHNKLELVAMARALGWRGDHARAPMLQIALFVATRLASGERPQSATPDNRPAPQGAPEQQSTPQGAPEQQSTPQGAPEQSDAPQGAPEQQSTPQGAPEQSDAPQGAPEQSDAPQGAPEAGADDEYDRLVKAAGIVPHKMLEKAWRITAKAGLNLMLVGPAGSAKTYLAKQLAQLLAVPFGSISCTMGMSESQLTGWLMPKEDSSGFGYRPSPFVQCLQEPSVFLVDELDASDPNVLMALNSVLSNGFITIPHKLDEPTVFKHSNSIVVGAVNTMNGATNSYTARAALDGSTMDRFYTMTIDYDCQYEKTLFTMPDRKSRVRSTLWEKATTAVDQQTLDDLESWFFKLRQGAQNASLDRIVSSRLAQRLVAACLAGIPVEEVKADLLLSWSDDERMRAIGRA